MFHLAASGSSAAEFQLDLTHTDIEPGDAESGSPSITGSSLDSMKRFLPAKLSVRDVSPHMVTPHDQVTVEVLLRNVGKEAIELPCRSGDHWRSGVHGQREINFAIELSVSGGKGVLIYLGKAFGASDTPGSFVRLAPGDTLVVRASASLRETGTWSEALAGPVEVKAAVSVGEARWDDTRFAIIDTSRLDMAIVPPP